MADVPRSSVPEFPLLLALLKRDARGLLRRELEHLLTRPRSERRKVRVMARLLAPTFEVTVILVDISRSGVSCLLPADVRVSVKELTEMTMLLRTATGMLEAAVSFVRLVELHDEWIHVAFRFDDLDAADGDRLQQLNTLLLTDLFVSNRDLTGAQ